MKIAIQNSYTSYHLYSSCLLAISFGIVMGSCAKKDTSLKEMVEVADNPVNLIDASGDLSQRIREANRIAGSGLLNEAIEAYRAILDKDKNNPVLLRNLGIVQLRAKLYEDALKSLEASLVKYQKSASVHFYLGETNRGLNQQAKAIFHYTTALNLRPKFYVAEKALAWSYHNIGYYDKALKLSQDLFKQARDDSQIAIIYSRTLIKLQRYSQALKVITAASEYADEKNLAYLHSVMGDVYLEQNDLNRAAFYYKEALKVFPLLAGSVMGLGRVYLAQGNKEKAQDYLQRAAKIKPTLLEAYFYLGQSFEKDDPVKSRRYYSFFVKETAVSLEYRELRNRAASLLRATKPTAAVDRSTVKKSKGLTQEKVEGIIRPY